MNKCAILLPQYNQRFGKCNICKQCHWFNIKPFKVDSYNLKVKMFKDYQREKYAKDLLQPIDKKGKPNKDFYKVYGDPTKQVNPSKITHE